MPIFMYECDSCGNRFEEIFMSRSKIEDVVDCHFCGSNANKLQVNRFRHIGPVFEGLDEYSQAFGQEMKTYKQIKKFEEKNNLDRVAPGSQAYKDYRESSIQEVYEMSEAASKGGFTGAADYVCKKEMQSSTGWSDMKYSKWKSNCEATESAARSGKIDISQKATALPQSTK
jgi:putative FmdB family regulatory protein